MSSYTQLHHSTLEKLLSTEDRGQTDRITMPTRAGLHHCTTLHASPC